MLQLDAPPNETLIRARELVPTLAEHAAEIERARRLTPDVLRLLDDIGCMRMAVAAEFGGDDLPLPAVMAVVEALARADGAIGWAVGQVALSQVMLAYLPPESLRIVYGDGPDVPVAGAAARKGRAVRIEGGWRISGQWPLVSGCEHAAWVALQCMVVEDGAIQVDGNGLPQMRMAVLPMDAVEIVDTWDAVGLRGTGSHDVLVRNAICPDEWSAQFTMTPPDGAAILRIPPPAQGGFFVAASLTGMARGAIDAMAKVAAGGKRPSFSPRPLSASPVFQRRFGDARVTLEAARALLATEVGAADARASAGDRLGPPDRVRLRATAVKAIELSVRAIDTAYGLAGSSSVYARSELQRRLRDAHAATQHVTASSELYAPLGALLAGVELNPAFV